MGKVSYFTHLIDTVNEWVGKIVSYLILFMMAIMVFEVGARYVFLSPTIWAHETSSFLFGVGVMLGGGYTLLYREHVNMDIIYNRFSLRSRATVDLITSILFFSFCIALIWKGAEWAWRSLLLLEASYTVWAPPFYPIKLMIPIGGSLLLLQGLAKFIRDLTTAIRRGKGT